MIGFLITSRTVAFCLISSMVSTSGSTADLLKVVSDRIARAFNLSEVTQTVALDISKAFDRVYHAGLLHRHKLKAYGVSGQVFCLIPYCTSMAFLTIYMQHYYPCC